MWLYCNDLTLLSAANARAICFHGAFPALNWTAMQSLSLDAILHRARALCEAAGIDPDQPGPDGKPEWFRFLGQARATLRRDRQSQDPLELLRAIDAGDSVPEAVETRAPESVDPLEKLQALYEAEMGDGARTSLEQTQHESLAEPKDFGFRGDARTASREKTDPLAELKALEAAQSAWRPEPPDEDDDPRFSLPE
ncbi:hypothetical protein [Methylocystis echinoides]|nr:hypothetical protein [Methylocystis echinoides]